MADSGSFLTSLSGLRAVAALMVVMTHVGFHTGFVRSGWLAAAVARLDLGVCLFFLLSGFLLYRPWARAAMTGGAGPSVRGYALKRFARVYPAYLVLVVVVLGLYPPNTPAAPSTWATYLTLTQNLVPGISVSELGQTWSVAVEVSFYILLPALAWLAGRRHRGRPDASCVRQFAVLGLMVAVALVFNVVRAWTDLLPEWRSAFWAPAYLDWFAAGMALAIVAARLSLREVPPAPRAMHTLRTLAQDANTCLVVAVLLFAVAATPIAGKYYFDGGLTVDTAGPWALLVKHGLYALIAGFVLLPLVLGDQGHWFARFLATPVMDWLGRVSYGIFLWHLLVLAVAADLLGLGTFQGGMLILLPVTVAVSIAVAALSWVGLERPILRWAHRRAARIG